MGPIKIRTEMYNMNSQLSRTIHFCKSYQTSFKIDLFNLRVLLIVQGISRNGQTTQKVFVCIFKTTLDIKNHQRHHLYIHKNNINLKGQIWDVWIYDLRLIPFGKVWLKFDPILTSVLQTLTVPTNFVMLHQKKFKLTVMKNTGTKSFSKWFTFICRSCWF